MSWPEVKGYRLVHGHTQGRRCHAELCWYKPTWLTRLLWALR